VGSAAHPRGVLAGEIFLRKKISGVLDPKRPEIVVPKGFLCCKKICRENLYRSTYSFRVVILQPLVERSVGEKKEKREKKDLAAATAKTVSSVKHMRPPEKKIFFLFYYTTLDKSIFVSASTALALTVSCVTLRVACLHVCKLATLLAHFASKSLCVAVHTFACFVQQVLHC
jgi:hypothetical protein